MTGTKIMREKHTLNRVKETKRLRWGEGERRGGWKQKVGGERERGTGSLFVKSRTLTVSC